MFGMNRWSWLKWFNGLIRQLPKEEMFNLTNQLRRAAVSIPSNIADGCARKPNKELLNFGYIALGSSAEIETQLLIAKKIYRLEIELVLQQLEKVKQVLLGFIRFLKTNANKL